MKNLIWLFLNAIIVLYSFLAIIPFGDANSAWSTGGSMSSQDSLNLFILAIPGIIIAILLIIFQKNYEIRFILKPLKWFNVLFYSTIILTCIGVWGAIMFNIIFVFVGIPILFINGLMQDIKQKNN
jgi:hypothetical protein